MAGKGRYQMTHTLHLGDCRIVLATLDDDSIDSIVCDPPYELGLKDKSWDRTGIAYDVTVWKECLRVLKPGGHLLAFGGSRTYHRMAVAIEDAEFDIRDQIMWIYGSGFPKSHNIGKAMDKQAGIWRGRAGAMKENNEKNVFGNRYDRYTMEPPVTDNAKAWDGWDTALKPAHEPICVARKPLTGTVVDNVLTWGEGTTSVSFGNEKPCTTKGHLGSGGASRFFYTAKTSKSEREAGLNGVETRSKRKDEDAKYATARANPHPTVKPLDLMRYLIRLVTPKGGTVLDPFLGSGSTGCAAVLGGFDFVGIDITPEYIDIATKRIEYYATGSPLDGV